MASVFKSWFTSKAVAQTYRVPPGDRIYAIGDVHGRLDLFEQLVLEIEADDAVRNAANTTIILLGDLVDRGPASSGVVDAAIKLGARRSVRTICGNHEEMLLKSLVDAKHMKAYLNHGGRETVLSYLEESSEYNSLTFDELIEKLHGAIPKDHLNFLQTLEDKVIIGDYLFVHAGVRPGIGIDDQALADMRWIREPFLSVDQSCGYCVVHGHTISDEPEVRPGRIGIDTGAYQSGRLTALGLEGTERWFLSTH
jgi:serine/threonine protein phosphatase 1